jgi:uncharacterized membrane protein required for colicin V production
MRGRHYIRLAAGRPPAPMTIDLLLIGCAVAFGVLGGVSGAIKQLTNGLGMIAAYLGARPLAKLLTLLAPPNLPPAVVNVLLSAALFILLYALAAWAARRLFARLLPNRQNGPGDRAFGFLLGAGKAAFVLYAALSLALFFEVPLTKALGAPPPAIRDSACVAFTRRHDLFRAVPVPALAKIQTLIDATKNPGSAKALMDDPDLRRFLDDPQLKAALQDDSLARALKSGDMSALKDDPRLQTLLKDPKFALPTAPADEPR